MRSNFLNLLAVGMENLLCNGKGAPYFGRVEFEGGLWRWPCRCEPNGVDTISVNEHSPGDRLCDGKGEPYLRKAYLYAFTKVYQDWAGEFSIFRPSSLNLPVR